MNDAPELFPASDGAMLSPKRGWLQRHGLTTSYCPGVFTADESESLETGDMVYPWGCTRAGDRLAPIGWGDTEDEACADFAIKAGIPLWNEEMK